MSYHCPYCHAELTEVVVSDPSEGDGSTCYAQDIGEMVLVERDALERYVAG